MMQQGTDRLVMLAAGGTGGHLFPAQALAEELTARGFRIHLMTDERVRDYGKNFPAQDIHIVPSATLSLSDPLKLPSRALKLWNGYRTSKALFRRFAPAAVAGFGGYPSLPPLLAAVHQNVPTLVHEQNAVLGRANRMLAKSVNAVATSFPTVLHVPENARHKIKHTGNPVRSVVMEQARAPYPKLDQTSPIQLLIFGGSQGARVFADIMPGTLALLPIELRKRLRVTQQCREEDLARTTEAYTASGIQAELNPFFMDIPRRMAASHLVVCRSGASSIAELGVIGRPAVLVPLPHALDNDQLKNAESFASAGAGFVQPQNAIIPQTFADMLAGLLNKPQSLKDAADAALRHGQPKAAQHLADLLQSIMATS
jgi:UDP-N-acetylglucosamine--N-acetylmuramyl-(pentapeptide) pyrophosphoryl-undecaprenol N-acetylglucosamine transferase